MKMNMCKKIRNSTMLIAENVFYTGFHFEFDQKLRLVGAIVGDTKFNEFVLVKDGTTFWIKNGEFHREYGPAIDCNNGTKEWFINGKRHRKNGPAVEYADGSELWYLDDKLHREGGPAINYVNRNAKEWWLNGIKVKEE